jgi:hypothetical protein
MILGGAKASLAHVVIFLPLQLEGVALTRNCTFWVVREKNESEQDFKKAWDDFRAANFDEEKEEALEKTLSLFCKIARRNSNPAELALTYVK